MIPTEKIVKIAEECAEKSDLFLVSATNTAKNEIALFVDSDSSVSIEACIALSKAIEAQLDRDKEDFELNVSSAGLDMPLKLPRQYKKYVGKELDVTTTEGIKYRATLTEANDSGINLSYQQKELVEGKKRKQMVDKFVELLYTEIKTTFVTISFK